MMDLLAQATAVTGTDWPLEIVKIIVPALFGLVGVWLALWIWHLKKRSEPGYESRGYIKQKRLDSLLKAWSLLAYMTEVENPKAVLLWEKQGKKTIYYLCPTPARQFMDALSEMFYGCGCGLLLDGHIKELFYEYRGHLYGILLKAGNQPEGGDQITVENDELVRRLKTIYNELNKALRKELETTEK